MITGYFNSIDCPTELQVGHNIAVTTNYSAFNPEGSFTNSWKVFIVAEAPGDFRVLFNGLSPGTVVRADHVNETRSYNVANMPPYSIGITFTLWAHEDSGYSWDWDAYDRWLNGLSLPEGLSLLAWDVKTIEYTTETPPPEEFQITGLITSITPTSIGYGQSLEVHVAFNAYNDDILYQPLWFTRLNGSIDGLTDSDVQTHSGQDGSRPDQPLYFGIMPSHNLSGTVKLYGQRDPIEGYILLDTKNFSIQVTGLPPGNGNGNGGDGGQTCAIDTDCPEGYVCENGVCVKKGLEIPWQWVIAGVGALILLLPGPEPERSRKRSK